MCVCSQNEFCFSIVKHSNIRQAFKTKLLFKKKGTNLRAPENYLNFSYQSTKHFPFKFNCQSFNRFSTTRMNSISFSSFLFFFSFFLVISFVSSFGDEMFWIGCEKAIKVTINFRLILHTFNIHDAICFLAYLRRSCYMIFLLKMFAQFFFTSPVNKLTWWKKFLSFFYYDGNGVPKAQRIQFKFQVPKRQTHSQMNKTQISNIHLIARLWITWHCCFISRWLHEWIEGAIAANKRINLWSSESHNYIWHVSQITRVTKTLRTIKDDMEKENANKKFNILDGFFIRLCRNKDRIEVSSSIWENWRKNCVGFGSSMMRSPTN